MRALALALAGVAGTACADPLPLIHCPGHPRCLSLVGQTQVQLPSTQGPWLMDLPELPETDHPDPLLTLAQDAPRWWHDHRLIALTRTETTGYSGGGALVDHMILLHIGPDGLRVVLSLPLGASKTIRACFSEADIADRNQHCADLYDYDAELTPLPDTGTPPSLRYNARATTFPPGIRLDEDNSALPVPSDAEPATDPTCTFTRTFHWDVATASYSPDAPLPDCGAYWGL
ncbi:MAG: hypothetical protein Q4G22_06965 [Paracoccus sp. (in: a-proteobacteria)]|uniref:hypothetical protein n=1 Tax=Paracoccus sp. TaxID=267 RepID=UPI0026E05ECB|nr:hypothetical protein [Paracoccus sp. (in: a-proteobacteria)]MDO5631562.1 hypothetical protein [Paracoccus sp. (in: a-proteobacteria)]